MAHSVSARKRIRQNQTRNLRNRARKSRIKTEVRKLNLLAPATPREQVDAQFRAAVKAIDQIAAKGAIHRNKAARLKSRLARRINNLPATS